MRFFLIFLFLIFFSAEAFAVVEERVFDFEKTSCSKDKNLDKVFKLKDSKIILNIDASKGSFRKITFTKNNFKEKISEGGSINLKGKYGNLKGYYNFEMAGKIILLKFEAKKNSKYISLNNCSFVFKGNFEGSELNKDLARQEKIINTLTTRIANKIINATGGDKTEINIWTLDILMSLNFEEALEKTKERSKTQKQILKVGIDKFSTNSVETSQESQIEKKEEYSKSETKIVSTSMDGEYMLFWKKVSRQYSTEHISDYVVDIVRIKKGELEFIKLNKEYRIQQENREKIIFKLKEDHFIITGNLDFDTARKTQPVYIKGSNQPNKKGQYVAETLYDIDKKRYLQIVFQPIFNENEAAKVCLYQAGSIKNCERSITCSYKDNIYTCSREYEKVESQCMYVDGIYSCNGKVIDFSAQKKSEEEKKRKEKELAAKKKQEEEEAKKKAQELAAKKKQAEELKQKLSKKIQEFLSILGFYKGSIDGNFGRESLQALNEWRTSNNLNKVISIDEMNEKELLFLEKNTDKFIQNKKKEELAKKKEEEERKRKELVKSNKERQLAQIYINDLIAFNQNNPNEFDIITLSELMISNKDILEGKWDNKLQQDFELLKVYTQTIDSFVQFLKEQEINRKKALLAKIASEDLKIKSFINNAKNYLQKNLTSPLSPEILKQIKMADEILNQSALDEKKEFNKNIIKFITENDLSEILEIETDIVSDKEDIYKVDVRKVQKNLKDLGYYTGSIDGNFGEESLRSYNQWAKENNLEMLLSIDEINEKQFNFLEEQTIEFVKKQEENSKLKLEKFDDQKRLAQIFINDLIAFNQNNPNEFDIITLSELMISNKDILEGKWDNKLQKDFDLLKQYILKSQLFEKFHLLQNENRQNQLILKINELNDNISDIIDYFKFYLQNNMTSNLIPEILQKIKNAEEGISIQDIEGKQKYIADLMIFIESKKLNEDFNSFLDSIKPQKILKADDSKADEIVNNNKLSNVDFIKNIGGSDLIVLVNLSGKAPNAILNLGGEIVFENDEAISCFYQSKEIQKNKRYYYYDKIPDRKFLINDIDIECKQNKLLNYDLIFFVKNDLLKENQEYAAELIKQIQSDNLRYFNVVTKEQYENDILERKNFAKQIKKDVMEGVRLGYGSVAINNENTTLCSDIKDNQETHKSIINLLQNEFNRLGYSKEIQNFSFKAKENTFFDVQREKCGFLYVDQDSLSQFIQGFEKTKTEYEIMPIWYSPKQIDKEKERLEQINKNKLIDEQKRKEEEEKKHKLKQERLKAEGTLKAKQEGELREKNRNVVESHIDFMEKELDKFFNPEIFTNSLIYTHYKEFSKFMQNKFIEKWELDRFTIVPFDYGKGEYRNRQIDTFSSILEFKLKNNKIGDYENYCIFLTIMDDEEFKSYREPLLTECDNKSPLQKYQKKHKFKSEWRIE